MRISCCVQVKNILLRTYYSYFFHRYFSKFSEQNAFKTKDPFKKKAKWYFTHESDSRNASRICITIFGNGGVGQPRCIGLFTEFKG